MLSRRLMQTQPWESSHPSWGPLAGAQQLLISYEKAAEAGTVTAVREILVRHGGWLGSYLPETSLLGVGSEAAAKELRMLKGVTWLVSPHPADNNWCGLHISDKSFSVLM